MRALAPIAAVVVLAAAACGVGAWPAAASPADAGSARGAPATTAAAPSLAPAQAHYLALARAGVASAQRRWHDRRLGWYDELLGDRARYPLATIWDIAPLFEAIDAIAIAQPTAANRAAVARFGAGAERYLNRGLRPVPGYSPYPGDRTAGTETWFDDNGWWGLAFVNAYRATGARRWLKDAQRALDYIAAAGWDARSGGIWWNTTHPYKSGPALASDTLLATLLYQQTGSVADLARAQRFLAWANTSGFSVPDRLYADSNVNSTPIDYVEAPLIYAQALLCRLTSTPSQCARAEQLKATALRRFGYLLDFSPQYDAIYVQWMLALYALDGDPTLYRLAADNARNAEARARSANGVYLLSWNGETLPAVDAKPGMLQTHAATTSLFAWLAVATPPA